MDVESSNYVNHAPNHPAKYVMLQDQGGDPNLRPPPPYRRNVPRYHTKPRSRRCTFCCCCCYCCCTLLIIFLIFIGAVAFLFSYVDPKRPSYNISDMKVSAFQFNPDLSLSTEFTVIVRAENPNKKVAIFYGKEGAVAVTYNDSTLCYGKLPAFRQGHRNTTILHVVLKGKNGFGSGLQTALMENKKKGRIPLGVYVRVPVRVVIAGKIKTPEVQVTIHCHLVVDNLSANKKVNILSAKYEVGWKFS